MAKFKKPPDLHNCMLFFFLSEFLQAVSQVLCERRRSISIVINNLKILMGYFHYLLF